ncbi:MAG: DUF3883 domain-containing protein [Opitutales bacterium]
MTLLFCNVGWMELYKGLGPKAKIVGGGSYVKDNERGHEVCNFEPHGDKVFGYVRAQGEKINIKRLGGESAQDWVDGLTVVWTATRPSGGSVVVGWYRDARVFQQAQTFSAVPPLHRENGITSYWIEAPATGARLLPVDERVLEIPRGQKGGMGQSNVWYADGEESAEFVTRVRDLIEGHQPSGGRGKGGVDPVHRVKVEQAAIKTCWEYFDGLGYKLRTVEKDNVGWDLEASRGQVELIIEVKGLSGVDCSVELTPNEFKAFNAEDENYRLCVVTNALISPKLIVCRFSGESGGWIVEDNSSGQLEIRRVESARISIATQVPAGG